MLDTDVTETEEKSSFGHKSQKKRRKSQRKLEYFFPKICTNQQRHVTPILVSATLHIRLFLPTS